MNRFSKLIDIQLEHAYYANALSDLSDIINCSISVSSYKLIKQANIVIKYAQGRILVSGNTAGIEYLKAVHKEYLLNLEADDDLVPLTLRLVLSVTRTDFYHVTENIPAIASQCWFVSSLPEFKGGANELSSTTTLTKQQLLASNEPIFHTSPELSNSGKPAIALIEIDIQDLINAYSSETPMAFNIHFDEMKSYWRYLIRDEQSPHSAFLITDRNSQYHFTESSNFTLNQQTFLSYLSDLPIPINQLSQQYFELHSVVNQDKHEVLSRLPVASPGVTQKELIHGEQAMVSEIFVYLN